MQTEAKVISKIKNGIGVVEFYHPKSNSLPKKMLIELAAEFNAMAGNPNVKVVVLESIGERAFCAGASFDELLAIKNSSEGKEFFMGFADVVNAMRKCHKFILVRVHGKVIGGGVGLIASADYAFALDTAAVRLSELSIGFGPFVVGPVIERKIGRSAFAEMTIDHDWHTAEWALQKGLFNKVFQNTNDLDEGLNKLAADLAQLNPAAMEKLKAAFWEGTEDWDNLLELKAAESGELVLSDFAKKSIHSFKQK
ncbi:enoyl-CoA hydratase/isomerase family protein [Bacteroidota bacterium]